MKVVLFSVLILITAVQTDPKLARPSSETYTTGNRRETRKYSRELSTGEPFTDATGDNGQFREFSLPKIGRGFLRNRNRPGNNRKSHGKRDPVRWRNSYRRRKPEPILNFRSPKQLQEYLFSEAGNARHILRSGGPMPSSRYRPDGSEEYSRNSRGSDSSLYEEFRRERGSTEESGDVDWLKPITFRKPIRERIEWNRKRRRKPILLPPYEFPFLYPPPWYGIGNPFYVPRDEVTPGTTAKPSRSLTLGEDLVRLKQMVDELDAMSEESKEGGSSAGKSESEKRDRERNETIADMKEKIDKVIIPMLNKISRDLNGTISTPSPPPKKAEPSDGDGKKPKEKEKDKEADNEEAHLKNNFPCRIDGLWACTTEALRLNISTLPNMTLKVTVVSENSKKSKSIAKNCGFITKDWAINGVTLATTGGPFLLAAICPEQRKVANFIGQCRSCREEDIIFGLWTFSTAGRGDCTEIFTSFETKLDVFKREKGQHSKGEKSKLAEKT